VTDWPGFNPNPIEQQMQPLLSSTMHAVVGCDDGGWQCRHVIPMSMTDCNTLDLAHRDGETGAIAYENVAFGSGAE
jgi:hypothetical protein